MKTYKQFIAEIYYPPNEPLPGSGQTPAQKAEDKYKKKVKKFKSLDPKNKRFSDARKIVQFKQTINRNVSHGSDNPNYNLYPTPGVRVEHEPSSFGKGRLKIHHPSGVSFYVSHRGTDESGRDEHEVIWGNKEIGKKFVARHVPGVFKKDVLPRLPHNSVIKSWPVKPPEAKRNVRAERAQKVGLGPQDDESGEQKAIVGRQPSPKQQEQGKTRLTPIIPKNIRKQ